MDTTVMYLRCLLFSWSAIAVWVYAMHVVMQDPVDPVAHWFSESPLERSSQRMMATHLFRSNRCWVNSYCRRFYAAQMRIQAHVLYISQRRDCNNKDSTYSSFKELIHSIDHQWLKAIDNVVLTFQLQPSFSSPTLWSLDGRDQIQKLICNRQHSVWKCIQVLSQFGIHGTMECQICW